METLLDWSISLYKWSCTKNLDFLFAISNFIPVSDDHIDPRNLYESTNFMNPPGTFSGNWHPGGRLHWCMIPSFVISILLTAGHSIALDLLFPSICFATCTLSPHNFKCSMKATAPLIIWFRESKYNCISLVILSWSPLPFFKPALFREKRTIHKERN